MPPDRLSGSGAVLYLQQQSSKNPTFYRFSKPTNPAYPKMIELFSRPQNNVVLQPDTHLMPLHIDDEVSSLSAIMLDDDYYRFLLDGQTVADDISVLDVEHIIPLKMKAWLDLNSKKEEGLEVNSKDVKKHCLDVFRLFQLVRGNQKVYVPKSVGADISNYIEQMRNKKIPLKDIGVSRSKDSILDIYSQMYISEKESSDE